jgi:hypothetical protein
VSATSVGVFGQGGNAKGLPTGLKSGVLGASAANPGVMGWSGKSKGVYGVSGPVPSIGSLLDYTKGVGGVIGASIDAAGVVGLSQNHALRREPGRGYLARCRCVCDRNRR